MRYILNKKDCVFLGKGKEGEVYLTPEGYALKIFYKVCKAKEEVSLLEKAKNSRFFPKVLFIAHNMILREYVEGINLKEYIEKNNLSYKVSCEIINLVEEFRTLEFTRINMRNAHIFVNADETIKVIDPRKVFVKQTPYPKDIVKVLVKTNSFDLFLKHLLEYKPYLMPYWINSFNYFTSNRKKTLRIDMYA